MYEMDALVTFGAVFTSTGSFSLSSLLTIIYSLFLKPYLAPLTVNITLISQSTDFAPTAAEIDAFLREQFGEESNKWMCTLTVKLNRYNGPARNAFHVSQVQYRIDCTRVEVDAYGRVSRQPSSTLVLPMRAHYGSLLSDHFAGN